MTAQEQTLAVAYIRVSTDEQKIGPHAQESSIRRWCRRHEVILVCDPFIDHGVSGGAPLDSRPALLESLEAMDRHGATILIAHKRDRIARDRLVISQLELMLRRHGRRICTTDFDPSSSVSYPYLRAMEGLQDTFAEFERSMIRARVQASIEIKRKKGQRIGTVPYGWRVAKDGKTLVLDPEEQKTMKTIKILRKKGESFRSIAKDLDRMGMRPRSGKLWHPSTIRNIANRRDGE